MHNKGVLVRPVTRKECFWLKSDLPEGKEIYEFTGCTYGCISNEGVAVSDKPDTPPFYEVPADTVSWSTAVDYILTLPTDLVRVAKLRAKLSEYKRRLARGDSIGDSTCKIAVLGSLLEKGYVNLNMVSDRLLRENAGVVRHLCNAFEVITDYCNTGGTNTSGGTGLK